MTHVRKVWMTLIGAASFIALPSSAISSPVKLACQIDQRYVGTYDFDPQNLSLDGHHNNETWVSKSQLNDAQGKPSNFIAVHTHHLSITDLSIIETDDETSDDQTIEKFSTTVTIGRIDGSYTYESRTYFAKGAPIAQKMGGTCAPVKEAF
jgi:hypothetical protein